MNTGKTAIKIKENDENIIFWNIEDEELKKGFNPIIYKSNCIIQASGFTKPAEMKLYNVFHSIAFNDLRFNPEKKTFETKISDLVNFGGLNNKDLPYIRETILSLMHVKIQYDVLKNNKLVSRWAFPLLQYTHVEIWEDEKTRKNSKVIFMFSEKILELIKDPRAYNFSYTKLNVYVSSRLNGLYAMYIYQYLKQYEYLIMNEKIKKRDVSIEELRKLTNTEGIYPEFSNFRDRVLEQAKKEINGKDKDGDPLTDIIMDYRLKKTWKKFTGVSFTFEYNPKFKIKGFKETKKEERERLEVEGEVIKEQYEEQRDEIFDNIISNMNNTADRVGEVNEEDERLRTFAEIKKIRYRKEAQSKGRKEFFNLFSDNQTITLNFFRDRVSKYLEFLDNEAKIKKNFNKEIACVSLKTRIEEAYYNQDFYILPEKKERKIILTANDEEEKIISEKPLDF